MTPEQAALDALRRFIDAAVALDGAWNEVLDAGYPGELPSFDEFLNELIAWREQATLAEGEQERRKGVLARATLEGFRSGVGDEVAILCADCRKPMLVIMPESAMGPDRTRCVPCGAKRFVPGYPQTERVTYGVGTRVMFRHDTDRYPHFIVPAGTEGTVVWEEHGDMLVKIDGDVPGLTDSEEWEGEFQWYPSNGDEGEPPFVAIESNVIRLTREVPDGR